MRIRSRDEIARHCASKSSEFKFGILIHVGKLIRVLFALTAVAPLSISLAFVFAVKGQNVQWATIAALLCLLLGALSLSIVRQAREKLEALPT